jgi:hypothetical protein
VRETRFYRDKHLETEAVCAVAQEEERKGESMHALFVCAQPGEREPSFLITTSFI